VAAPRWCTSLWCSRQTASRPRAKCPLRSAWSRQHGSMAGKTPRIRQVSGGDGPEASPGKRSLRPRGLLRIRAHHHPAAVAADKARLHALIAGIHDEGSTNLTAGWMLGRDEVAKARRPARKLLLLTDGHLNQGIIERPRSAKSSAAGWRRSTSGRAVWVLATATMKTFWTDSQSGFRDPPRCRFPGKVPGNLPSGTRIAPGPQRQNLRVRVRKLHYCSGIAS